jgi:hypothetical protein
MFYSGLDVLTAWNGSQMGEDVNKVTATILKNQRSHGSELWSHPEHHRSLI